MNDLLHSQIGAATPPVECLGLTFPSDQARREHFLNLLGEKLKDPAFRTQEGFPLGTDEAILAMSDPPYYTACPNPFLGEFVQQYGKPYDPTVKYLREPLAIDVSVGKTDQLYRAHSYHTKVPHLAIVPSILHYTEPGDIVLDGFSGSGMTGVAAQWCGSAPAAYRHELEIEWKKQAKSSPKWGARRIILNDLSPAATFIAANYNLPFDVEAFAKAGKQLLKEVEQEIGWMYETTHTDGKTKGRVEYMVWSEVFTCPNCAGDIVFLNEALNNETKRVKDSFECPHCAAQLTKGKLDRVLENRLDPITQLSWKRIKLAPALISYRIGNARYKKEPDANDLHVAATVESFQIPAEVPNIRFPIESMYHGSRIAPKGFTHTQHFFVPRALQAVGLLWKKASENSDPRLRSMLLYWIEQSLWSMSVMNKYEPIQFGRADGNASQVGRFMKGVYYEIPPQDLSLLRE
ncbi:DNA methyltransferase [Candidatus Accumulibacter sp. ACC012]|uniref:DNA methyltransferase n=1 Tax=Candidatus Accumulibacter sp. ACC012 TaxID=2823332 RepID=UPI0034251039